MIAEISPGPTEDGRVTSGHIKSDVKRSTQRPPDAMLMQASAYSPLTPLSNNVMSLDNSVFPSLSGFSRFLMRLDSTGQIALQRSSEAAGDDP